jgi:hypothetical protein
MLIAPRPDRQEPSWTLEERNPNDVGLRRVVRAGYAALCARLDAEARTLPQFVHREMEQYLACGDLGAGFAWLECPHGHHHRLVPTTCKGRGFCPTCGGRRMAERAGRWTEELLPRVAVRQVVFTVPWPRRWLLARDADLLREVVETMRSEVTRWLRRHGVRGLDGREGEPGSVSVIQRFGSTLTLNVHVHMLLLDGLFVADARGAPVWRRARRWRQADVDGLVVRVAAEVERLLARRGHGPNDPLEVDPDDALADLQEAAVAGRSASSTRRAQRVQRVGGRERPLPPLCASCDGYTVHAGVVLGARDRAGIGRLAQYVLRPALVTSRLEVLADGSVRMALKRAWSDGTTSRTFTALELVERLAALVPPPAANQVVYGGVLAPRHRWHRLVRPAPRRVAVPPVATVRLTRRPRGSSRHVGWAELLWSTFGVFGAACPTCGAVMRLRAVVWPPATLDVLASLRRSARGPPPGNAASGA